MKIIGGSYNCIEVHHVFTATDHRPWAFNFLLPFLSQSSVIHRHLWAIHRSWIPPAHVPTALHLVPWSCTTLPGPNLQTKRLFFPIIVVSEGKLFCKIYCPPSKSSKTMLWPTLKKHLWFEVKLIGGNQIDSTVAIHLSYWNFFSTYYSALQCIQNLLLEVLDTMCWSYMHFLLPQKRRCGCFGGRKHSEGCNNYPPYTAPGSPHYTHVAETALLAHARRNQAPKVTQAGFLLGKLASNYKVPYTRQVGLERSWLLLFYFPSGSGI